MNNLKELVNKAKDKSKFGDLKAYIKFCEEYLHYIRDNLQAIMMFKEKTRAAKTSMV